jgi:hypothetical protein
MTKEYELNLITAIVIRSPWVSRFFLNLCSISNYGSQSNPTGVDPGWDFDDFLYHELTIFSLDPDHGTIPLTKTISTTIGLKASNARKVSRRCIPLECGVLAIVRFIPCWWTDLTVYAAPVSDSIDIPLVSGAIKDQQTIFQTVFNETDISNIPQVWALCKTSSLSMERVYQI